MRNVILGLLLLAAVMVALLASWSGSAIKLGKPNSALGPVFTGGSIEQGITGERMAIESVRVEAVAQFETAVVDFRLFRAGSAQPLRESRVSVPAGTELDLVEIAIPAVATAAGETYTLQFAVVSGKVVFGGQYEGPGLGTTVINGLVQPESTDLAIGVRGSGRGWAALLAPLKPEGIVLLAQGLTALLLAWLSLWVRVVAPKTRSETSGNRRRIDSALLLLVPAAGLMAVTMLLTRGSEDVPISGLFLLIAGIIQVVIAVRLLRGVNASRPMTFARLVAYVEGHNWKLIFAVALLAVAFAVRLLANDVSLDPTDYTISGDEKSYVRLGRDLAEGRGYVNTAGHASAIRPPLYPMLIAALHILVGEGDVALARLLQSLIGAATCVGIFLLALRLGGASPAVVAGLWSAIYAPLLRLDSILYSETLFLLLIVGAALSVLEWRRRGGSLAAGVAGLAMGLAALTRPAGLVLPLMLILAALPGVGTHFNGRRRFAGLAVSLIVFGVTLAPWTTRNYLVFGDFIPGSTMMGNVVLGANNGAILNVPHLRGLWISAGGLATYKDFERSIRAELPEPEADRARIAKGLDWMRSHVDDMPMMLWWRFTGFLALRAPGWEIVSWGYYATFLLAIGGAAISRGRWRDLVFLYSLAGSSVLTALVFYGSERFRAPGEPLLIILASTMVVWMLERSTRPWTGGLWRGRFWRLASR